MAKAILAQQYEKNFEIDLGLLTKHDFVAVLECLFYLANAMLIIGPHMADNPDMREKLAPTSHYCVYLRSGLKATSDRLVQHAYRAAGDKKLSKVKGAMVQFSCFADSFCKKQHFEMKDLELAKLCINSMKAFVHYFTDKLKDKYLDGLRIDFFAKLKRKLDLLTSDNGQGVQIKDAMIVVVTQLATKRIILPTHGIVLDCLELKLDSLSLGPESDPSMSIVDVVLQEFKNFIEKKVPRKSLLAGSNIPNLMRLVDGVITSKENRTRSSGRSQVKDKFKIVATFSSLISENWNELQKMDQFSSIFRKLILSNPPTIDHSLAAQIIGNLAVVEDKGKQARKQLGQIKQYFKNIRRLFPSASQCLKVLNYFLEDERYFSSRDLFQCRLVAVDALDMLENPELHELGSRWVKYALEEVLYPQGGISKELASWQAIFLFDFLIGHERAVKAMALDRLERLLEDPKKMVTEVLKGRAQGKYVQFYAKYRYPPVDAPSDQLLEVNDRLTEDFMTQYRATADASFIAAVNTVASSYVLTPAVFSYWMEKPWMAVGAVCQEDGKLVCLLPTVDAFLRLWEAGKADPQVIDEVVEIKEKKQNWKTVFCSLLRRMSDNISLILRLSLSKDLRSILMRVCSKLHLLYFSLTAGNPELKVEYSFLLPVPLKYLHHLLSKGNKVSEQEVRNAFECGDEMIRLYFQHFNQLQEPNVPIMKSLIELSIKLVNQSASSSNPIYENIVAKANSWISSIATLITHEKEGINEMNQWLKITYSLTSKTDHPKLKEKTVFLEATAKLDAFLRLQKKEDGLNLTIPVIAVWLTAYFSLPAEDFPTLKFLGRVFLKIIGKSHSFRNDLAPELRQQAIEKIAFFADLQEKAKNPNFSKLIVAKKIWSN